MNTNSIDQLQTLLESSAGAASDTALFLTVHLGTCGIAAGAGKTLEAVRTYLASESVQSIELKSSGCAGLCSCEPMVTIEEKDKPAVKYIELTAEKTKKIFAEHVLGGKIVNEYALAAGSERTL